MFLSKRNFAKDEKGNALYVISSEGGEARQILKREEGIGSPKWAPDSKSVFFTSSVVRKEKDDVKVITRRTFWFNGLGFVHDRRTHLFSCDIATKKATQHTKGEIEVGDFAVSHDGKKVAYVVTSDDIRPYLADIFVLDVSSRRSRKLTKAPLEISSVAWSPDDSRICFAGSTLPSGFASHRRIWTIPATGGKLTKAEDEDRNKSNSLNSDARAKDHGPGNVIWTKDGIYYPRADGGSVHLCLAKPGEPTELVIGGERSVEGYAVNDGTLAFVAMDSRHLEELYFKAGRGEKKLTELNAITEKELEIIPPERFTFKASDGEPIEGWLVVPASKKKVPLILYVHGGPKTAFGNSYVHEFQAFAAAGYAVVFMNPRGSDGYSEKFADIRGRYGTRDYDDLMEGLDRVLKAHRELDGTRVAIAGGSYGGFMTNWAIGHTDRFKAAVTDRCISSWTSFWGTSDIGPYFTRDQVGGDPWNSEEKLLADSPLTYVQNVKTPLLIVHSMEDFRCWMVEGLEFFSALKELGKEAELVLFPGESHDLSRTGKPKHRVVRLNHYLRWFGKHLK